MNESSLESEPAVDGPVAPTTTATDGPAVDLTGEVPVLDTRSPSLDDAPAGAQDELVIVPTEDDGLARARLFDLEFVNDENLTAVIAAVLDGPWADGPTRPVVVTPNVDIVVQLHNAPQSPEAELYRRARFCLPDGQPIVAVSGLFGPRLGARLPGSSLFAQLWPEIVAGQVPVVVLASSDEVADLLAGSHPGATTLVAPFFDHDDAAAVTELVDRLLAEARERNPRLVFVGIGHPKDARLVASFLDRWDEADGPPPLCLALGCSFLMYLGLKKRAPAWVQRIGMEWFYRFAQEPRRLFHRYFVRDLAFFGIVARHWRAARTAGKTDPR